MIYTSLFPAIPKQWRFAEFATLRVVGGHLVSARLENGAVNWVKICSEQGGRCVLAHPFAGGRYRVEPAPQNGIEDDGACLAFNLSPGETLTFTRIP